MEESGIVGMVEFYLPVLATAGDYAREIQPRISGPAQKSGGNAWTQALTDADQGVQAFVEVATLARFPDVDFYGEEQEHSRNARYFPAGAPAKVWLDPINGTFLYKNQRPGWDIILSISLHGRLVAAISYMPVRERFYLALRGRGAYTGSRGARRLEDLVPLTTVPGSPVCVTYQAPEALARLGSRWKAFDIVEDDDPARDFDNLDDLFTGRLGGYASASADLLDWGAMALIVTEAGGRATHLDGRPFDGFEGFDGGSRDLLVAATPEMHREMLAVIRDDAA